ncbi:MAG: hypothetical protein HY075_09850 [Deltaproteobacteria bacterium]|nr:hypothetical protein [Deltaproteobacteria bacterium]
MLAAVPPLALADNVADTKGQSKENGKFESDSTFQLPDFWKIIKKISPEDGRVRIEYQELSGFANDANNDRTYNVSLETYIFGTTDFTSGSEYDGNVKKTGLSAGIIPLEFRIAVKADDSSRIDLRDLRIGAIRFLQQNSGVTVQVASYVMKRYPGMFGTFHGAELVDLVLKSSAPLVSSGMVELVVKADLSLAIGATTGTTDQMRDAKDASGVPGRLTSYLPVTVRVPVSGSIGVRIAKKLLIETYGGADVNLNYADNNSYGDAGASADHTYSDVIEIAQSNMYHLYAGGGLRLQWHGFVMSATLQRDWYLNTFSYEKTITQKYDENPGYDEPTTVSTDKKTGSHPNSDRGYTGMLSIGYDW